MLKTRSASFLVLVLLAILCRVIAVPDVQARQVPTVILDNATVMGITVGSTNQFLGIPFSQPPTGNLRFQIPQALPPYDVSFSATSFGPSCPQQQVSFPFSYLFPDGTVDYLNSWIYGPSSEDCLTLNVVTPFGVDSTSKLPVVVWIFGGGFEFGGTNIYDGGIIVERSIQLGVPAIYVSMNYRVNAFGFLASQEVLDAGVGNLGLRDQRLALQWVQKYITAFGGDPTKVTIWGESSGAISVALQMLTNKGNPEGLFRAAFMQSGAPIPVGNITNGQPYYDALVEETGCVGTLDTLQCLREVPYETLLDAVNNSPNILSYQSLILAWMPRADGDFLAADPQELVLRGSVADVPFVNGNCDDEGTAFSFSNSNITTNAELEEYLRTYWLPNAPNATIAKLLMYYPADPTEGSPFDTGYLNVLTPQFKRLAALQGDTAFQAPRRFFLQNRSGKQNIWTYVSKRFKWVPFLGSFHGSDLFLNTYVGGDLASYLVRFVTNLDPNVGLGEDLYWPQYVYGGLTGNETMLALLDGSVGQALTTDGYRVDAMAYVTQVALEYPV